MVALLLLLGCSRKPAPLTLVSVTPGSITDDVEARLTITAGGLSPMVSGSILSPEQADLRAQFTVELVDATQSFALLDVRVLDAGRLAATVPRGLPLGMYGVRVIDPRARVAILQSVVEVVDEEPMIMGGDCTVDADCAGDPCVMVPQCDNGSCVYDLDVDGDGVIAENCGGTDCDDSLASVRPAISENCGNGIDDNCDELVDGADVIACPPGCADLDGDGFFDVACGGTDCDDNPNGCGNGCFPGNLAADICDNVDQDCDGTVDEDPQVTWYRDEDLDGFTHPTTTQVACGDPDGAAGGWLAAANGSDCDDSAATGAGCSVGCVLLYSDGDGDGFGFGPSLQNHCPGGGGLSANADDCDDTDAQIFPGSICDDADACTENDVCQGGVCRGHNTCVGQCDTACDAACGQGCCIDTNCVSGACDVCPDACSCDRDCPNGESCTGTCESDSTCNMQAAGSADVALDCNSSICSAQCSGQSACDYKCNGNGSCSLSCTGQADCKLDCFDNATCLISCEGSAICNGACPTTYEDCGGGVMVCNQPCP